MSIEGNDEEQATPEKWQPPCSHGNLLPTLEEYKVDHPISRPTRRSRRRDNRSRAFHCRTWTILGALVVIIVLIILFPVLWMNSPSRRDDEISIDMDSTPPPTETPIITTVGDNNIVVVIDNFQSAGSPLDPTLEIYHVHSSLVESIQVQIILPPVDVKITGPMTVYAIEGVYVATGMSCPTTTQDNTNTKTRLIQTILDGTSPQVTVSLTTDTTLAVCNKDNLIIGAAYHLFTNVLLDSHAKPSTFVLDLTGTDNPSTIVPFPDTMTTDVAVVILTMPRTSYTVMIPSEDATGFTPGVSCPFDGVAANVQASGFPAAIWIPRPKQSSASTMVVSCDTASSVVSTGTVQFSTDEGVTDPTTSGVDATIENPTPSMEYVTSTPSSVPTREDSASITTVPTLAGDALKQPGRWVVRGDKLPGQANNDPDNMGIPVAISGDGRVVAARAPAVMIASPDDDIVDDRDAVGNVKVQPTIQVWQLLDTNHQWVPLGRPIKVPDQLLQIVMSADGSLVAVSGESFDDPMPYLQVWYLGSDYVWEPYGQAITGFGHAVALSADGGTLAASNTEINQIAMWRFASGGWQDMESPMTSISSTDQGHVTSLALSDDGSILAVGVLLFGDQEAMGSVYMFRNVKGIWIKMPMGSPLSHASFGRSSSCAPIGVSVALSGDGLVVAVGDTQTNDVRVYDFDETMGWHQRGNDIVATDVDECIGYTVGLSEDGTVLTTGLSRIVGAKVHYWSPSSMTWISVVFAQDESLLLDEETLASDVGSTVALSRDGFSVAIGAPNYSVVIAWQNAT